MLNTIEKVIETSNPFIQKIKNILDWTRKKVELNESYFSKKRESLGKPYASMGDIYYAYLGTNIGAEIDKARPVLVFQNDDRYLKQSNMVFIIPISSNTKLTPYKVIITPSHVCQSNEINRDSAVIIQQSRSISKNRLHKYIGSLSPEKIKEVALELKNFLYKDNPLLMEGDAQTIQMDAAKS